MAPTLDRDSTPRMAAAEAPDVLVILGEQGAARRELGEAVLDELTAERLLTALELRAERDGFASLRLWPARYPDYALEVHQLVSRKAYWQTGQRRSGGVSRGRALGLLRLFAGTLEKGGAA